MKGKAEQLAQQGKIALKQGAQGVVLFSYSNLASSEGNKLIKNFFDLLGDE